MVRDFSGLGLRRYDKAGGFKSRSVAAFREKFVISPLTAGYVSGICGRTARGILVVGILEGVPGRCPVKLVKSNYYQTRLYETIGIDRKKGSMGLTGPMFCNVMDGTGYWPPNRSRSDRYCGIPVRRQTG